jgi:hypothetical protein
MVSQLIYPRYEDAWCYRNALYVASEIEQNASPLGPKLNQPTFRLAS